MLLLCAQELPDSVANHVQGGLAGTEADGRIWADYLVELTTAGEPVVDLAQLGTPRSVEPPSHAAERRTRILDAWQCDM
ncbi:MAG: hypothetical protein JOZ81_22985 [Chloroflexi bacterium]|nr:hypothetical protein [Chloroflexota bacterium]MBV9546276.1 hypothetical protein [Chloroflexota bacterium]